jgi:hypothetical protein
MLKNITTPLAVAAVNALALPATATTAHAATGCGTGVRTAKFYANNTLKGDPKKTACDTLINEN